MGKYTLYLKKENINALLVAYSTTAFSHDIIF